MLRPRNDHVVVLRDDAEDVTPGGIILPDNAQEKPAKGEVVAMPIHGLKKWAASATASTKPDLHVGDKVIFSRHAGTEVNIDLGAYVIIDQKDILAVVETEPAIA